MRKLYIIATVVILLLCTCCGENDPITIGKVSYSKLSLDGWEVRLKEIKNDSAIFEFKVWEKSIVGYFLIFDDTDFWVAELSYKSIENTWYFNESSKYGDRFHYLGERKMDDYVWIAFEVDVNVPVGKCKGESSNYNIYDNYYSYDYLIPYENVKFDGISTVAEADESNRTVNGSLSIPSEAMAGIEDIYINAYETVLKVKKTGTESWTLAPINNSELTADMQRTADGGMIVTYTYPYSYNKLQGWYPGANPMITLESAQFLQTLPIPIGWYWDERSLKKSIQFEYIP